MNDCGELATGRHGLPFSESRCEIVSNDFPGTWVAMPSCQNCHDVHAAGGVAGLDAHLKATEGIRADLSAARAALKKIRGDVEDTLGNIGEGHPL